MLHRSPKIIVTGNGTDVGKTVVSAILVELLGADYWKPIQCGCKDSTTIEKLTKCCVFPSAYEFSHALSPHHCARLDHTAIEPEKILIPHTDRPLIIETAGGPFVPLSLSLLTVDLMQSWEAIWIVVSRHYIGSINHTLLTLEGLKNRRIPVEGLIFNGTENPDSENAIVQFSGLPVLGRLTPQKTLSPAIIKEIAAQWKQLRMFGSLTHK